MQDRIAIIRQRCEVLGLVQEPTDEELNLIEKDEAAEVNMEKDLVAPKKEIVEDDDSGDDDEFFELSTLMGKKVFDGYREMPRFDNSPAVKPERTVELTEGLCDQMLSLGLDPNTAVNGNHALGMIDKANGRKSASGAADSQRKEALGNFLSILRTAPNSTLEMLGLDFMVGVDISIRNAFIDEVANKEIYVY